MPKFKGLPGLAAILLLSLLLAGCNLLPFTAAEPEEEETVVEEEGLPEWLLSEHRGARSAEAAEDDDALLPKDEDDEEESDEGNDEPAPETAEQQPTGEAAATEPQQGTEAAQQQGTGTETDFDSEDPGEDQQPEVEEVSNKSWMDGTYTGEWLKDRPHGRGTYYHPSGAKLAGNWVGGNPDGRVTFTDPSGNTERIRFDEGDEVAEGHWWNPKPSSGDTSWFD